MTGFLNALAFLTRLPIPIAAPRLETAVPWMPVVGLCLGGILAVVDLLLRLLPVSPLLGSTVLVVLLLLLTGALHADGLMDTCDAAFVHATPERRLEIMRDPRTGTFGAVGLVCVVALKIASLEGMPPAARVASLLLAPTLGRWSIVLLATLFPYGRLHGLGAPLKQAATRRALVLASVVPLALSAILIPIGPVLALAAGVSALGLGWWLMRLLPGLTGDSYGASCELVETMVWLIAALLATILV